MTNIHVNTLPVCQKKNLTEQWIHVTQVAEMPDFKSAWCSNFETPFSSLLWWSDSVMTEELGGNFQTTKIWVAAKDVFSIVMMVRFCNNKATEVSRGHFQTTKIWVAVEDVFSIVTVIRVCNDRAKEVSRDDFKTTKIWTAAEDIFIIVTMVRICNNKAKEVSRGDFQTFSSSLWWSESLTTEQRRSVWQLSDVFIIITVVRVCNNKATEVSVATIGCFYHHYSGQSL